MYPFWVGIKSLRYKCAKTINKFLIEKLIVIFFLSPTLNSKMILGNAHDHSEELERAREVKEKDAAL